MYSHKFEVKSGGWGPPLRLPLGDATTTVAAGVTHWGVFFANVGLHQSRNPGLRQHQQSTTIAKRHTRRVRSSPTAKWHYRKGAEATLVPVAEFVLGKKRILEIYLNIVEWGPGIYRAEAACRYYDGIAARNVGRQQAARLAAILPAPLKRRPERMNSYSAIILGRMSQLGW